MAGIPRIKLVKDTHTLHAPPTHIYSSSFAFLLAFWWRWTTTAELIIMHPANLCYYSPSLLLSDSCCTPKKQCSKIHMHLNLKFIARRLTRTCIQPNSTSTAHNNVAAHDAVAAHLPPPVVFLLSPGLRGLGFGLLGFEGLGFRVRVRR